MHPGHGFDSHAGINSECINRWNKKWMSLSLSKINKNFEKELQKLKGHDAYSWPLDALTSC